MPEYLKSNSRPVSIGFGPSDDMSYDPVTAIRFETQEGATVWHYPTEHPDLLLDFIRLLEVSDISEIIGKDIRLLFVENPPELAGFQHIFYKDPAHTVLLSDYTSGGQKI